MRAAIYARMSTDSDSRRPDREVPRIHRARRAKTTRKPKGPK